MGETTTYSCDVCGKADIERYAVVAISNSHYGARSAVWPNQSTNGLCCSADCVRKQLAQLASEPFNDAELRVLAEQAQPNLAAELASAKARITQLEASLAQRPVAPDPVVTKNELADLMRQLLQERRGFSHG